MATITTKAEQVRAGRLAHRLGGYSELLRLAADRQRLGPGARLVRDRTGRFIVVAAEDEEAPPLRAAG